MKHALSALIYLFCAFSAGAQPASIADLWAAFDQASNQLYETSDKMRLMADEAESAYGYYLDSLEDDLAGREELDFEIERIVDHIQYLEGYRSEVAPSAALIAQRDELARQEKILRAAPGQQAYKDVVARLDIMNGEISFLEEQVKDVDLEIAEARVPLAQLEAAKRDYLMRPVEAVSPGFATYLTMHQQAGVARDRMGAAQQAYVDALDALVEGMRRETPPFVEAVEIRADGALIYEARWRPTDGLSEVERLQRMATRSEMLKSAIAEMDAHLAVGQAQRLRLAQRQLLLDSKLIDARVDFYDSQVKGIIYAAAIEAVGSMIELYATGGTGALKNITISKGIEAAGAKGGAYFASDYLGETDAYKEFIDGFEFQNAIDEAFGDEVEGALGIAIEKAIAGAPAAWRYFKEFGKAAGSKLPAKGIRDLSQIAGSGGADWGAVISLATTAAKVAVKSYYEVQEQEAYARLMEALIEHGAIQALKEISLGKDATIFNLRAEHRKLLAALQYQQHVLNTPISLDVLTNETLNLADKDVSLDIVVTFSRAIDAPPTVTIGPLEAPRSLGDERDGASGTVWKSNLFVSAASLPTGQQVIRIQNTGSKGLDGEPGSVPRPDPYGQKWFDIELVADANHRLMVAPQEQKDLDGIWLMGSTLILLEQVGEQVTGTYHAFLPGSKYAARGREIGEVSIDATREGQVIDGTRWNAFPPEYKELCGDHWASLDPITLIYDGKDTLTGTWKRLFADAETCELTTSSMEDVTLKRADEAN